MKLIALSALVAVVVCSNLAAQIPAITTQVFANSATNGISSPIYICSPPGDLTRWFIVQKTGYIKVKSPTVPVSPSNTWGTFLDIHTLVSGGSEQGLLGLAFHPNYATNGYFFVNYTDTSGNTQIKRYQVSANPDVANAASATAVLSITQPESNHNGGNLQFGPDGYLYIGMGDGGGGYDQHGTFGNAQNLTVLLGKMLRINVDTLPYTIPSTNPFAGATSGKEIWAYGLRNPWRWSFDRLTGDLWIGDVGQDTLEEIDFQPATPAGTGTYGGRNYGWRCREGTTCTGLSGCTTTSPCQSGSPIDPVTTAPTPSVTAIMGGYVYRGCAIPQLRGWYFYGYYGTGAIMRLKYNGTTITGAPTSPGITVSGVVSFGEDGNGELYICSLSGNTVYKVIPSVPQMVGVVSYGTGTPGCSGLSVLSMGCSPTDLNPGETINATHEPPNTTGIGVIAMASLPPGSDPFGVGVETLVDVSNPNNYFFFYPSANVLGSSTFPLPIPYVPSLVGITFYAQEFFLWSSCSPSAVNYNSTQGIAITIQA